MDQRTIAALDRFTTSLPFKAWAVTSPIDARKVRKAIDGKPTPKPSSTFGRELVTIAQIAWESPTPPPPPPPPPPPVSTFAPRTYNEAPGGEPSARFCIQWPGVVRQPDGTYRDAGGARYDENGLSLGGRTNRQVAGLKPANEMDGRSPCELYPPLTSWPADSFLQ